jgi:DNA polymerase-3 subunit chi
MAEALFYHLTERPLEAAAPEILEKCLERGWRVTLRAGAAARLAALDRHLWTYRDDAFLPHGTSADGHAERQPIYLTAGREAPNDPQVLMLVEGAEASPEEMARFERTVLIFDGGDQAALDRAREAWRAATGAGLRAVYWAQEGGRWVKKREQG